MSYHPRISPRKLPYHSLQARNDMEFHWADRDDDVGKTMLCYMLIFNGVCLRYIIIVSMLSQCCQIISYNNYKLIHNYTLSSYQAKKFAKVYCF